MDLIKLGLSTPYSHSHKLFIDWLLRHTVQYGAGRVCGVASLSRECVDGTIKLGFCLPHQPYHPEGTLFAQAIKPLPPVSDRMAVVLVVDDVSEVAEWETTGV